jgi:hypothetical protein
MVYLNQHSGLLPPFGEGGDGGGLSIKHPKPDDGSSSIYLAIPRHEACLKVILPRVAVQKGHPPLRV